MQNRQESMFTVLLNFVKHKGFVAGSKHQINNGIIETIELYQKYVINLFVVIKLYVDKMLILPCNNFQILNKGNKNEMLIYPVIFRLCSIISLYLVS